MRHFLPINIHIQAEFFEVGTAPAAVLSFAKEPGIGSPLGSPLAKTAGTAFALTGLLKSFSGCRSAIKSFKHLEF